MKRNIVTSRHCTNLMEKSQRLHSMNMDFWNWNTRYRRHNAVRQHFGMRNKVGVGAIGTKELPTDSPYPSRTFCHQSVSGFLELFYHQASQRGAQALEGRLMEAAIDYGEYGEYG